MNKTITNIKLECPGCLGNGCRPCLHAGFFSVPVVGDVADFIDSEAIDYMTTRFSEFGWTKHPDVYDYKPTPENGVYRLTDKPLVSKDTADYYNGLVRAKKEDNMTKIKKVQAEIEDNLMRGAELMLQVLLKEDQELNGEHLHNLMRERAAALAQEFGQRIVDGDK